MKQKMKAPGIALLVIVCAAVLLLWFRMPVPYYSGSAAADLTAALEGVYGPEYTGKTVENGTEDMRFEIEAKTGFFRQLLGLDHKYECRVIFTTHTGENTREERTVTYQAVDPMGPEEIERRASIDWDSGVETTR
ncbi:MAG: hypothetical protein IJ960_05640 [Oscillospiraceae bacterium]|nr:hypothetical protein [Oscillospiraceae bacterium]